MISYLVIVGDTLTKVIISVTGISPESILVNRHLIIAVTTLTISLPVSLYRLVICVDKARFTRNAFHCKKIL